MSTTTTDAGTPIPTEEEQTGDDLGHPIRDYERTCALWHGRAEATGRFGVSHHTSWRCQYHGHLGRALPRAVIKAVREPQTP